MRAWLGSTLATLATLAALATLVALAACGGGSASSVGLPIEPAADLAIVAHADDDLVFLQPALFDAVQRGTGVTNLYVTAGDGGLSAAEARVAGLQAAWGAIAGSSDWTCGDVAVGDHPVTHCRLPAARLSLIFLGYPGGGEDGAAPDSLLNLWQGNVAKVTTIAAQPSSYDQASLIQTVAQLIDLTAPATLRTLEIAATHGRDQSDHMLSGALAVLATAASTRDPMIVAARGDNIADAAANVDLAVAARSADALARYEACASGCATCGTACALDRLAPEQVSALARSYPIAMRTAAGQLRTDGGCVTVTVAGGNAAVVDCATAPSWQLDGHGRLRASSNLCLRALFTGEVVATPCGDDGVGGRFFFDDEGHLWSGLVPAPDDDMAFAHLDCLINAGGRPRVALCGADRAPLWQLAP